MCVCLCVPPSNLFKKAQKYKVSDPRLVIYWSRYLSSRSSNTLKWASHLFLISLHETTWIFFSQQTHTQTRFTVEGETSVRRVGRKEVAEKWPEYDSTSLRMYRDLYTKRTRERRCGVLHARASSTMIIDSQKDKISRNISVFFYFFFLEFSQPLTTQRTHSLDFY